MQPYVMDQQWVRIGDSSPLARNVRRTGVVFGRVVDRGGERKCGAEVHGPVGWTEISRHATQDEGLSQEIVADALGVTFQQFQKYERAINRISAGTVP
jgi:hypothetical protein